MKTIKVTIKLAIDIKGPKSSKPMVNFPTGSKGQIEVYDLVTKKKLKFIVGSTAVTGLTIL